MSACSRRLGVSCDPKPAASSAALALLAEVAADGDACELVARDPALAGIGALKYTDEKIDISDLAQILVIDPTAMTCTAEPGVTFADLFAATLPLGLAPIVVPELPTITIGGAVSGWSLDSTSFKYGGFHDTCLEYELVTARGDVLRCTPDNEHQLLFQMIHGSFGTLGILSKFTFRLLAVRLYVRVAYEQYDALAAYEDAVWRRFVDRDIDFMDGMIHSPTMYVLSLGRFVDEAPYTNRYDWTKVYYRSTATRGEDYLRTRDYFFRYDMGVTNVRPKSALGRLLCGKFMHSDRSLRLAERLRRVLPVEHPDITLDMLIPFSRLDAFLDWYRRELGHFPVWCVPASPKTRFSGAERVASFLRPLPDLTSRA